MTGNAIAARYFRSPRAAEEATRRYAALLDDWPVPAVRHRLATRQGDTFVVECGAAEGPPVVLLHGSVANSSTWAEDAASLAPHFRLYAVDMIGEPGFSAPSRPSLASDEYASWLDDVFDALGLESAAVAGISLGGWLGLDFAIRRPQRVASLGLIVPGGVSRQRNVLVWALPLSMLGAWGRTQVSRRILGSPPANPTEIMRRVGELHAVLARYFRPRYDRLPIFTDQALAGLSMPLMAVVAGRDVMLASGPMRDRLQAHVRDLEMHYLPEAAHFPGSQATRLLEFLKRQREAQPATGA